MKVTAKCMNHSGCLKAFRGETIELDKAAPLVCPECGKPLATTGGGAQAAVKGAVVLVGVLVLALGGFVAMKALKKNKGGGGDVSPTPDVVHTDTPPVTPDTPLVTPDNPNSNTNTNTANTTPDVPPGPATSEDSPITPDIRKEVLARIDEMPDLTPDKKDRLYTAVLRARDMRKVIEIPFGSGQSKIQNPATDQVKTLMSSGAITKFRDDLTAIFVVLGFADSKGSKDSNLAISRERANSVKEHLERNCGVKNIIHSVPMGSTTLVDKSNSAKNRIVEIWAVLP